MSGGAEVIVAGGTESMSMIPMGGHKISPNPWLVDHYPDAYLTMGLTAERVAQRFGISRDAADEFSLKQPPESDGRDSCRQSSMTRWFRSRLVSLLRMARNQKARYRLQSGRRAEERTHRLRHLAP